MLVWWLTSAEGSLGAVGQTAECVRLASSGRRPSTGQAIVAHFVYIEAHQVILLYKKIKIRADKIKEVVHVMTILLNDMS